MWPGLSWLRSMWHSLSVEPVFLLFSVCQGLYMVIAQSLYISKVCEVNLGYDKEICDNIYSHPEIQNEVQKKVSVLQVYNGILQALPSIVYTLFAGPWSDANGRKTLIICSCFGYIFNNAVFFVNAYYFYELRAEWLLLECLQDCTGGYVCFFLASYAYVTDISGPETRTKRLAYLDGLFPIGFSLGMAFSGIVKKELGYLNNFALGMLTALLAMAYALIFLRESRKRVPKEKRAALMQKDMELNATLEEPLEVPLMPAKSKLSTLFDLTNLRLALTTTFAKRPFGMRRYVVLMAAVFAFEITISQGKGPVLFLYVRKVYAMDEAGFSQLVAVFGFVGLFTQIVVVPFLTGTVGLHDSTVCLMAVLGCTLSQVIMATTSTLEWLYIAFLVGFLAPAITTTARSLVSKCVSRTEVGAVFAVMGAFQAAVPLFSSPLYGLLYRNTLEYAPNAFLYLSASLYIFVGTALVLVNLGLRGVERRRIRAELEIITRDEELIHQKLMEKERMKEENAHEEMADKP